MILICVSSDRTAQPDRRRSPAPRRAPTCPSVRTCWRRSYPSRASGVSTTVTRSRPWQTAQRVSTSSLPGPLGSATDRLPAAAPGPKLVVRYWMTVSASRGVNCAPRSTMLWTWRFHPTGPSRHRHDDVKRVALRAGGRDECRGRRPAAGRRRSGRASGAPVARVSATSAPGSRSRFMVTPSACRKSGDRIGRMPGGGGADAVAIGVNVEEIGPAVGDRALGRGRSRP